LVKSSGKNKNIYIPDVGDIGWTQFDDPAVGHEQGGHRRAIIVSPMIYNRNTSKAIAFPITTKIKGYKFEVPLSEGLSTIGAILSQDIKSIDWKARKFQFIEKAPKDVVLEVLARLKVLIPLLDDS
jgi:mRNA interferase MazF